MRHLFQLLLLSLFFLATTSILGQDAVSTGLPYNPDSDNNGSIDVNDLLIFLPYYGMTFDPEGVIPISFGGTGASSVEAARDSLHLSAIQDSTVGTESYAWVSQSLRVQQEFAQGYGSSASGIYWSCVRYQYHSEWGHTAMPKIGCPPQVRPAQALKVKEQLQAEPPAMQKGC